MHVIGCLAPYGPTSFKIVAQGHHAVDNATLILCCCIGVATSITVELTFIVTKLSTL